MARQDAERREKADALARAEAENQVRLARESAEKAAREAEETSRRDTERREAEKQQAEKQQTAERSRQLADAGAQAALAKVAEVAEAAAVGPSDKKRDGFQLDSLESDLNERLDAEQKEREEAARHEREQTEKKARLREEKARQEAAAALAEKEAKERAGREREEAERQTAAEEQAREQDKKASAKAEAEAAAKMRKEARLREKADTDARKRSDAEMYDRKQDQASMGADRASKDRTSMSRPSRQWGKPIAITMFGLLLAVVGLMHVMPLNAYIPVYEKLASARFGQPVTIGSVRLSLFPAPQLRFEKVAIGTEPQARFSEVRASPELGSLLGELKIFKSVELDGAVVPTAMLAAALWGNQGNAAKPFDAQALRIERFVLPALKLELKGLALPPLNVEGNVGADGRLTRLGIATADKSQNAQLMFESDGVKVEIAAKTFPPVFGAAFNLDDFAAKGVLTRDELMLSEFEAKAFEGRLNGKARLKWVSEWTLDGEVAVRLLDPAKLVPQVFSSGKLEGRGAYSMRSVNPAMLFPSVRLEGSVKVEKGTLNKIDFTRLLQQSGTQAGGSTLFSELNSGLVVDAGRVQLRNLRIAGGLMSASGAAEVGVTGETTGRIQLELRSGPTQSRASLALSGNVKDGLQLKR